MNTPVTDIDVIKYYFESGKADSFTDTLVVEHRLNVTGVGMKPIEFSCTPEDFKPLILGRLYTDGIISSFGDIGEIYFFDDMCTAEVLFKNRRKSSCVPEPFEQKKCEMSRVLALIEAFDPRTELFKKTGAVHCCLISVGGRVRYRVQDIGRHNAIDKAVGMALADGVDFADCMLLTSGRVPLDIAQKVIVAGIPVMIARSAPTERAVELARRYHLKLMGFANLKQVNIYS